MKTERYLAQLKAVIDQATDSWDIERMRQAVIEARALVENKAYAIKQADFNRLKGDK